MKGSKEGRQGSEEGTGGEKRMKREGVRSYVRGPIAITHNCGNTSVATASRSTFIPIASCTCSVPIYKVFRIYRSVLAIAAGVGVGRGMGKGVGR